MMPGDRIPHSVLPPAEMGTAQQEFLVKGFAYWHGTALVWSWTKSRIKHAHYCACVNDRFQWGTSQSPGPLVPMSKEDAQKWAGFFDIS